MNLELLTGLNTMAPCLQHVSSPCVNSILTGNGCSRKRLIGRIFTQTFAVLRQINRDMDSPLRLFFIVTTVNKMTTDQYSE